MFPNYGFRAMLTKICVIWIISTLFAPSGISGNIICDSFKDEELTKARTAALERHNIYRCMHGAPPLVLDDELTEVAQTYSKKIGAEGQLTHSSTSYGENLYESIASSGTPNAEALMVASVDAWWKEVKDYKGMKNSDFLKTGHFTQVVWKESSKLGMGIAISAKEQCGNGFEAYVVGNYNPRGNMQDEESYGKNVQARPTKLEDCGGSSLVPEDVREKPAENTSQKPEANTSKKPEANTSQKPEANTSKEPEGNTTETSKAPGKTTCRVCYLSCILLFILVNYDYSDFKL